MQRQLYNSLKLETGKCAEHYIVCINKTAKDSAYDKIIVLFNHGWLLKFAVAELQTNKSIALVDRDQAFSLHAFPFLCEYMKQILIRHYIAIQCYSYFSCPLQGMV